MNTPYCVGVRNEMSVMFDCWLRNIEEKMEQIQFCGGAGERERMPAPEDCFHTHLLKRAS